MVKENRLIKKIQRKGDQQAADCLIRHYYDDIYNYVRKQVQPPEQALDLTQEIFISKLRTIQYFDEKHQTGFRTWLYRIATNKIIDWFRSKAQRQQQRSIVLEEGLGIEDSINLKASYEDKELLQAVIDYLDRFPIENQQILRLHLWAEYPFVEIAQMLNLSEGTVKSKYYRTLEHIRREFRDDYK